MVQKLEKNQEFLILILLAGSASHSDLDLWTIFPKGPIFQIIKMKISNYMLRDKEINRYHDESRTASCHEYAELFSALMTINALVIT